MNIELSHFCDPHLSDESVKRRLGSTTEGEAIYRRERLTASYVHFYFPSSPEAAARLFLP